jgi:hypothetical protein
MPDAQDEYLPNIQAGIAACSKIPASDRIS